MKKVVWLIALYLFSLQINTCLNAGTTAEEDAEFIRESIKSDRKKKLKLFLVKCLACTAIGAAIFYAFFGKKAVRKLFGKTIIVKEIEVNSLDTRCNIKEFLECFKPIDYATIDSLKVIESENVCETWDKKKSATEWLLQFKFKVRDTTTIPPTERIIGPFTSIDKLEAAFHVK